MHLLKNICKTANVLMLGTIFSQKWSSSFVFSDWSLQRGPWPWRLPEGWKWALRTGHWGSAGERTYSWNPQRERWGRLVEFLIRGRIQPQCGCELSANYNMLTAPGVTCVPLLQCAKSCFTCCDWQVQLKYNLYLLFAFIVVEAQKWSSRFQDAVLQLWCH